MTSTSFFILQVFDYKYNSARCFHFSDIDNIKMSKEKTTEEIQADQKLKVGFVDERQETESLAL